MFSKNVILFANVPKKFFTGRVEFENNTATNAAPPGWPDPQKEGTLEMQDLKETFVRNASTLPYDFAGVAALVVIFFTGLSLPSLF